MYPAPSELYREYGQVSGSIHRWLTRVSASRLQWPQGTDGSVRPTDARADLTPAWLTNHGSARLCISARFWCLKVPLGLSHSVHTGPSGPGEIEEQFPKLRLNSTMEWFQFLTGGVIRIGFTLLGTQLEWLLRLLVGECRWSVYMQFLLLTVTLSVLVLIQVFVINPFSFVLQKPAWPYLPLFSDGSFSFFFFWFKIPKS